MGITGFYFDLILDIALAYDLYQASQWFYFGSMLGLFFFAPALMTFAVDRFTHKQGVSFSMWVIGFVNFFQLRVLLEHVWIAVSDNRLSSKNLSNFKLIDAFFKALPQVLNPNPSPNPNPKP